MVTAADVTAAISIAQAIVDGIIKLAPAVEAGVANAAPYVSVIEGLITGANYTQDQLDELLASVNTTSAQIQQALPPDDGTTTT